MRSLLPTQHGFVALLRLLVVGAALLSPRPANAEGIAIEDVATLHRACRAADRSSSDELYVVELPAGRWRFARYMPSEEVLPVDTRRNLRLLGGSVEIFPSRFESVGFRASAERAMELRAVQGGVLRLGFFLGYDEPRRHACLIRPAVSVTTVRVDVAFVELLDEKGAVLAREDSPRLRQWRERREANAIAGSGPRGAIDSANFADGRALPESMQRELQRAELGKALGRCMADVVARGGAREGRVLVRLRIAPSGRAEQASVALSTLGDDAGGRCVAEGLKGAVQFSDARRTGSFEISVPVRLVAD